jgi:nitroreductase
VIRTRRSVRSYSEKEIPDATLQIVLDAARVAPSANNRQPWRYIVVREAQTIYRIAQLAANQMFIAEAPVVVVLCGRKYVNQHSWFGECMYLLEAAISMDHLMLAARNEGLGTCWVGAFDKRGIEDLLNIPPNFPPIMITPLGYPKDQSVFSDVIDRYPLMEICFSEEYGNEISL